MRFLSGLVAWLWCCAVLAGGVEAQEPTPHPESAAVLELIVGERRQLTLPGIQRSLIGDPDLLDVEQVSPDLLALIPKHPGRTFLHVWTAEGRTSRVVQILAFRPIPLIPEEELRRAIEHAEALRVGYDTEYELVHRGPTFSQSDQDTTTTIRHTFTHRMETPFGKTSSLVGFQRVNTLQELTTWSARLSDGHLGWLQDFDATAGDAGIPFGSGSFAVPSTGFRGASVAYRDLDPWRAAGFWGRERTGLFATPAAGPAAERDAFIYGFNLGYEDPASPWTTRASALFGYGDDRLTSQSNEVLDLVTAWRPLEPLTIDNELAFSEGELGYTLGTSWQEPGHSLGFKFRDIAEEFRTVVGAGGDQGERGLLLDARWAPTPRVSLRGQADLFRNRLFPNPAEPDTLNLDMDAGGDWRPWDGTSLSGFANRRRDLGLLSPTDDIRVGTSVSQQLPLSRWVPFLHDLGLSGRFEHLDSRSVTAPELDFDTEILDAGLSMPLGWGFTATANQQWHFLEETQTGTRTQPRRFSAGLSHFSSLGQGRWQVRGRFAVEDEANTGATRSFLAGQDRLVWEAGLGYRPSQDTDVFANGRIEQVRFEGSQDDRVEFAVFTGVRLLFDTQVVRWDPSAVIAGVVFHDLNGDGILQPGEEGLGGVKVLAGPARAALTDEQGRVVIGRVSGTAVPVSLDLSTLPKGYVVSTPQVQVIRPYQQPRPIVVFGALGRAEVRGRLFYDVDGDGRYSAPDRGLEGVRVQLDSRTAQTDRSGWFFFRDLPGGAYTMSLILESLPLAYVPLVPVRQALELKEGAVQTIDVPVTMRRTLEGRVYLDRNQNRQLDLGEEALRGIPICLDGRRVAATDASGAFRFPEMTLGPHSLALNCGMGLHDLLPLSSEQPTVMISPDDPETITVDFRLQRKDDFVDGIIQEWRKPAGPVSEL